MAVSRVNGPTRPLTPPAGRLASLVAVVLGPLALSMALVVLPASEHLAAMRAEVARLEARLDRLQQTTPTAERANGLLIELAEQRGLADAAGLALDRFARLERRLERRVAEAERAVAALDRLEGLAATIERRGAQLTAAHAALVATGGDAEALYAAIDRAGRLEPAVASAQRLAVQVAEGVAASQRVAERSLRSVEGLSRSQHLLTLEVDRVAAANKTLDGLVRLESRLNAPLLAVATSHQRLDDLLRLKDQLLAQTANLPAAFETLEMIVQLQADYDRARGALASLHRMMADLVLLEPSIARVASLVEPVIDRTTVGRLASSELRLVLRELQSRQSAAVAKAAAGPADRVAERPGAAAAK